MEHVTEVEARIRELVVERLEIAPEVVAATGPDTPLIGRGLGLDSVDALTLALGIDEDLTLDLFSSLSSVARFVATRLSAADSQRVRP